MSSYFSKMLFATVAVCGICLLGASESSGKKADTDTKSTRRKTQKVLEDVNSRIKNDHNKRTMLLQQEDELLRSLEDYDITIAKKNAQFAYFKKKSTDKIEQIEQIKGKIENLEQTVQERKQMLSRRLFAMYKEDKFGYFDLVIAPDDLYSMAKRYEYLRMVSDIDLGLIKGFAEGINRLEKAKSKMVMMNEELASIQNKLYKEVESIEEEEENKKSLIVSIRKDRTSYERSILELEKLAQEMKTLISESPPEKAQKKFYGLSKRKGKLRWPNLGMVVSRFGKQKHPKFDTIINKTGIEISSFLGDSVVAIYDGKVIYSDWFKGYGLLVIIDHGAKYYSLYGHLSSVAVKVGDEVSTADKIGEIGSSGLSASDNLYFEIRNKGMALNPVKWLKKKQSNVKLN